jgi:hypothetical protein
MNPLTMPTNEDLARERIETAWRDYPYCRRCGEPMTIEVRDDGLWIECGSLPPLRGIRFRLGARFHDRHAIELPDDRMMLAAA